jgi:hypothetical protein
MARGRPPLTRARVLTYWRKHGPCPIMQIVRATGAERRHVQRIVRAAENAGHMNFAASPA